MASRTRARKGPAIESKRKAKAIRGPAVPGQRQGPHCIENLRRGASQIPRPGSELAGYADHEAVVGELEKKRVPDAGLGR
jgi:hypothetical protein